MTNKNKTRKKQPRPLPCTDTGNMERFIRDHRHVIKSGGHDRQWHVWTGQRWKPSPRDAAFNLALETIENLGHLTNLEWLDLSFNNIREASAPTPPQHARTRTRTMPGLSARALGG